MSWWQVALVFGGIPVATLLVISAAVWLSGAPAHPYPEAVAQPADPPLVEDEVPTEDHPPGEGATG